MTDGSLFQMDDLETIVARQGLAITPNPRTDKLTWRGDTFQIVAVEPFVSGDQDAAYRLIVRR